MLERAAYNMVVFPYLVELSASGGRVQRKANETLRLIPITKRCSEVKGQDPQTEGQRAASERI